jgi:predicted choloylglycine hydrolase
MEMDGFSKKALIVAYSYLLDKIQGRGFVLMVVIVHHKPSI